MTNQSDAVLHQKSRWLARNHTCRHLIGSFIPPLHVELKVLETCRLSHHTQDAKQSATKDIISDNDHERLANGSGQGMHPAAGLSANRILVCPLACARLLVIRQLPFWKMMRETGRCRWTLHHTSFPVHPSHTYFGAAIVVSPSCEQYSDANRPIASETAFGRPTEKG